MCETLACFPHTMTALPNWVLWKIETVDGRQTKVPYSALYNGKASSTNPNTWTTFQEVNRVLNANENRYSGVGFVFTPETNLIFIDIDHCINDGVFDERATDILSAFDNNTFCEVSQSGTGLHLFVKGTIPKSFKNPKNRVEMYSSGRFVAMTGRAYIDKEPVDNPEALSRVYEKYKTPERKQHKSNSCIDTVISLSDLDIIRRASNSRVSGDTFRALFSGDKGGYPSQSEADFRLCQILAFWSNRDYDTIYRIIRSSGAYRDKWDRTDYSRNTIQRACDSIVEDLSEYIHRMREEEKRQYEKTLLLYW